jgi:DME family drug/metabolite transporter
MKYGMRRAGPNEVNPIRSFGFLAMMIAVMIITQPGRWPAISPLMALAVILNVGMSSVLGDQLYIYSINKIGASLAVSVSSSYPLITTVVSIFLLDEKITSLIWVGTIFIIVGLFAITHGAGGKNRAGAVKNKKERHAAKTMMVGVILASASAICSGVNTPIVKILMHKGGWNPVETYFLRSVAYILVVWSLRLVEWKKFPHIVMPLRKVRLKAWLAFIAGGCIALALGGILFAICVDVLPVSVVTPITASSPFITVLIARFFYREKLTRLQNVGVGLVIVGSLAVSL